MNATVETEPDVAFAQAALPLLKEYAEKLKELGDGVLKYWRESGRFFTPANTGMVRDELLNRYKHLKTPVEELIHQASAVLNEGGLRGLSKIALWLRLAELEHNLETAARRVDLLKPKK